ncbi:MAG: hypothetical protein Alis3KO_01530 [Aliiglaciecola sp.]
MKITKKKLLTGLGELAIMGLIIYAISNWQSRNLLDDDGSVIIENQSLVSLNGEVDPLFEENKRTLIYFFAPWCKVCELSINNLDYLNDSDLNVVRVALDYRLENDVAEFVSNNDVEGKVLLGSNNLKSQFQIPGYPTYYLLDEQRKIIGHSFGYSTALGLKLKNFLNK